MFTVKTASKFGLAALCACAFMGAAAPAIAGHSTGTWKYYSPYYAPAVPYGYGYRYHRAYPRYGYDDGYGYREHYGRRYHPRDYDDED
jgi:hypothetical protein